jgi:hypothetical protein
MSDRHLPVRPDLDQLKHQAKDLLRGVRRGDATALALFAAHHRLPADPASVKLAEAQHALARSYEVASWPRLVQACQLTDAIWRDDVAAVRALIETHPELLHEPATAVPGSNWGPPIAFAANLGRTAMIAMLRELGATELDHAFARAALQGQIGPARQLHAMGARLARGVAMGPAETQSGDGMRYLAELGVELADDSGDRLAPVACVLQTYCRNPAGKHECLELLAERGVALPDTPVMALHRGRTDLLERHLAADRTLLGRTFTHEAIYPPALGCHADHSLALNGTPLDGTTLLHQCVDFVELDLARWLLDRGADPNARATVDPDGFGGHTPLFGTVVTASGAPKTDQFARLLLDRGADPNAMASLRKRLRFRDDDSMHEYRDVTPLAWGARFHDPLFVNRAAMAEIAARGGRLATGDRSSSESNR